MESLACRYRPKDFSDVCSQEATIKILEQQLSTGSFVNCYLFTGPSGVGKTTIARILANKINQGQGTPIEIDGASNNGVDNVRAIIESAQERALDAQYKVFIIDECHAITSAGWAAFLKCLEEPPKYTIFMFCTTNPEKIPDTIKNRLMRFSLFSVSLPKIQQRLNYICEQEGFIDYNEGIEYIAKLAGGNLRDAISMLEKCSHYSNTISISNVLTCLGDFSYDTFFKLTNSLIDGDKTTALSIIDNYCNTGVDIGRFVDQYLEFILDLNKYCIFNSMSVIKIPASMEKDIKYTTGIENGAAWYSWLLNKVLNIKNAIRYDDSVKNTVEIMFLNICELK